MTLTELKSLKVGQVVKYTNDVDQLNVEYWSVKGIWEQCVIFGQIQGNRSTTIYFSEEDIDHIASMLTIDQSIAYKALEPHKQLERELKLIEAKIRDAEFDLGIVNDTINAHINTALLLTPQKERDKHNALIAELKQLRNQRNELIEKI